ncbi:hypothetical protein [Flagellimonas marina]|uniref:Uncharacterized protein n=1 Tax=Flagellimonas marina TaxID=1775168 RepID=A0ABV8PM78_9FLAO
MKSWFKNILEGSQYQGLEIFEVDNTVYFSLLKLKKTKDELVKADEGVYGRVEDLVPHIDKKQPLFLTLNTSKVLKKQIGVEQRGTAEQVVSQAYPNLPLENFYFEVLDHQNLRMVSISKKEYIVEHLEMLETHGIFPCSISMGISNMGNLLPYFKGTAIQGSNFVLSTSEDSEYIMSSRNNPVNDNLELNGLTLTNTGLLPFASILGHLGSDQKESNLVDINGQAANEFQNRRFFDLGVKWGLSIILVILLSNFLLFSYYHNRTLGMGTSASIEQQNRALETLRAKVLEKEDRLKSLMASGNSVSTFYLDRIAHDLPNSIQLDIMVYQPLAKPVRDNTPIEILENNILVSGNASDKTEFSQWTESMESKRWVENVKIIGYEYVSNSLDRFTVKITLNEVEQQK